MDVCKPSVRRLATSTLSLLAFCGLACWLPAPGDAQAQTPPNTTPPNAASGGAQGAPPTTPGTRGNGQTLPNQPPTPNQNGTGKTSAGSNSKTNPPDYTKAPNPLILNNPNEQIPFKPELQRTSKDLPNYQNPVRPPVGNAKQLPIYGIDQFKSARDAINARRAYYQRLLLQSLNADRQINTLGALQNANANGTTISSAPSTPTSAPNGPQAQAPTGGAGSLSPNVAALLSSGGLSGIDLSNPAIAAIAAQAGYGSAPGGALGGSTTPGSTGAGNTGVPGIPNGAGGLLNGLSGSGGMGLGTSNELLSQAGQNNPILQTPQNIQPNNSPLDVRYWVADPLSQFWSNINSNPPANYQLGPGDILTIEYSSPTQVSQTLKATLDTNGRILINGLGAISLVGKTLEGAEKTLQTQLRRLYNKVEVNVTLAQIRTLRVDVMGEVYEPGTYFVPATSTAFNLLTWAGGPTEKGSFREVVVRRNGKVVGTLDLYKYFQDGKNATDIVLESGDVLNVPPRNDLIAVEGEVRQQAQFELIKGETLKDALNFAGGVKASAVSQRIQIDTSDPDAGHVEKDVNLKDPHAALTPVFDGDVVDVYSYRERLTNTVSVEGAVVVPSDYAMTPNMRVSDLINRARGPLDEASPVAEIHHWGPDGVDTIQKFDLDKALAHDPANDVALTRWDRIRIFTRAEVAYTGHHYFRIDGEIRKPGFYTASKNMHVSDALLEAGGPLPDAYLERAILLHQPDDGSAPIMEYVNLAAILHGDSSKDLLVLDNDHLAIYSVGQAQFTPDHIVTIKGKVVAPGPYARSKDMRLSDLLMVSGGFTPDAGSQVVVTHARRVVDTPSSTTLQVVAVNFDSHGKCAPGDDLKLEDGDVVTIQGIGGFLDHVQTVVVSGAVAHPGPIPLTTSTMRLSDAIQKAGGLRKEAYAPAAEFLRDPTTLLSNTQTDLVVGLDKLNALLNENEYQRDVAKSTLDIITALGQATSDSSSIGLLGGLAGGAAAAAVPAATAGAIGGTLASKPPVTPARSTNDAEPNGNLAINLPGALMHPGGQDDILLKDGDEITIPETPTTVLVVGAVYDRGSQAVVYHPGEGIDFYIKHAGGMTPDAARDRIEIIRAGGGMVPAGKVGKILPGDVIVVPTKPLAAKISRQSNAINDFFKSITSSVLIYAIAKTAFGL